MIISESYVDNYHCSLINLACTIILRQPLFCRIHTCVHSESQSIYRYSAIAGRLEWFSQLGMKTPSSVSDCEHSILDFSCNIKLGGGRGGGSSAARDITCQGACGINWHYPSIYTVFCEHLQGVVRLNDVLSTYQSRAGGGGGVNGRVK